MLNIFKRFFKKEKNDNNKEYNNKELDKLLTDIQDGVESIDYDKYGNPGISRVENGKTILILDDIQNMWYLYGEDFKDIKRVYDKDVNEDFNIITCLGPKAGFIAHKFIHENYEHVDYAILDITLGYGVKLTNGDYVEYDGIDVFLELYKRNPDLKFIFCTAHTLNKKNPTVGFFFKKFEDATGLNFSNYYLNKNSERYKRIYELLYKD